MNVALCGEFFAVEKIKDFVNSSEASFKWVSSSRSCYCNYAENEILLQMPTIFGFPLALSKYWITQPNAFCWKQTARKKTLLNARKRLRSGLGGILAAAWRHWPGRNLPGPPGHAALWQKNIEQLSDTSQLWIQLLSPYLVFVLERKRWECLRCAWWECGAWWQGEFTCETHETHEASCCHQTVSPRVMMSPAGGTGILLICQRRRDNPGLFYVLYGSEAVSEALNGLEKCLKGV